MKTQNVKLRTFLSLLCMLATVSIWLSPTQAAPFEAPDGILLDNAPATGPLILPGTTFPDLTFSTPGGKTAFFTEGLDIELTLDAGPIRVFDDTSQGPTDWFFYLDETSLDLDGIDLTLTGGILTVDGAVVLTAGEPISVGTNIANSGTYAVAVGDSVTASGNYSFASGLLGTSATGLNSFAQGSGVTASNSHAVVFGKDTSSSGIASLAVGQGSAASGENSFARGLNTVASGAGSSSAGEGSVASGDASIAFGMFNQAQSQSSVALGEHTIATGSTGQFVCGKYNVSSTDAIFIVGNGTSGAESNALVIKDDGAAEFSGDVTVSGEATITKVPPKGGISMGNFDTE